MRTVITSPSLDTHENVSGVSSVTSFIIRNNSEREYLHFQLGKKDSERRNPGWLFRIAGSYFKWIALLLKNRDLMIHFNLAMGKLAILRDTPLIYLTRILGRSMIIHIHGGSFMERDQWPGWVIAILKRLFNGRTPLVVLSEREKELIGHRFGTENIWVLPNCVETGEAKNFKREFNKDKQLTLLFLGRITVEKGMYTIIEALEGLQGRDLFVRFILAGKGPGEEEYIKRLGEIGNVEFEFRGVVTGTEKYDLFRSCDIFLLPSRFEGLPMALLEAMSFAMVPVVTAVGSMGEVVEPGENGIVIGQGSAGELTDALETLAENRDLLKVLGNNARQHVLSRYDQAAYITSLNKYYSYA